MRIRAARAEDLAPLAWALAPLPLLVRYGRSADQLLADFGRGVARGDGLILAEPEEGAPGPGVRAAGENGPVGAGRALGIAWFSPAGTLGMGGYLRLIAVIPGAERQGLGRTLLGAFEAATSPLSRHAFLLVSDFNHGAQRFYQRAGYREVGRLPSLLLADVDELLYWKRLESR